MAPTWTQSALGSAFIKHHRAPSALGTEEWDLTRTRNNEKVMREPAHVTHSQGKDKMYRVSSSGRSAVHFLSFLLFLLYTWNEKTRSIDSLTVSSWSPTYLWNEMSLSLWYLFLHPYAEQDCTIVLKSQPKYQRCQTSWIQSSFFKYFFKNSLLLSVLSHNRAVAPCTVLVRMRGNRAHAQVTAVAVFFFLPGSKMAEMVAFSHVTAHLGFDWCVLPFHATHFCVVA